MQPTTFFKEAQAAGAIPQTARLQSSYQFGDEADQLAQLIIAGKKTATTSLYELYEKDGDELPTKHAYDVILDGRQQPVAIIKNDDVQVVDYLAVDATHAFAEGRVIEPCKLGGRRTIDFLRKNVKQKACNLTQQLHEQS